MEDFKAYIQLIGIAEEQFRLASAVRLATTIGEQPLDLPSEWVHGRHRVKYLDVALSLQQADRAAFFLQRSATFLIAVQIRKTFQELNLEPRKGSDLTILAAFEISRLIRNAFTHNPFQPTWSIDPDCRNRLFSIPDTIQLNTTSLEGKEFDWRDYGGPLAILSLSKFVRLTILKERPENEAETSADSIPLPKREIFQQGNVILRRISKPPDQPAQKG